MGIGAVGNMLSDKELAEIKERCDKATPGPWYESGFCGRPDLDMGNINYIILTKCGGKIAPTAIIKVKAKETENRHGADNAEFIANARTDIPKLLTEIELLKVALKGIEWITGSNTASVLPDIKLRAKLALGGDTLDTKE